MKSYENIQHGLRHCQTRAKGPDLFHFQIVNPIMIYRDRHFILTKRHHLHFTIQQRQSMKVVCLPKM